MNIVTPFPSININTANVYTETARRDNQLREVIPQPLRTPLVAPKTKLKVMQKKPNCQEIATAQPTMRVAKLQTIKRLRNAKAMLIAIKIMPSKKNNKLQKKLVSKKNCNLSKNYSKLKNLKRATLKYEHMSKRMPLWVDNMRALLATNIKEGPMVLTMR